MNKTVQLFTIVLLLTLSCIPITKGQGLRGLVNKVKTGNSSGRDYSKESEGITGPIHEKNVGKVLFSSQKISREIMNSDGSIYKTEFTLGEPIYTRGFTKDPISSYTIIKTGSNNKTDNYFSTNGRATSYVSMFLEVDGQPFFDGKPVSQSELDPKTNGKYTTTCQALLFPDKNDGGVRADVVAAINKLSEGKHTIRTIYKAGGSVGLGDEIIAEGTFTLVIPAGKAGGMSMGRSWDSYKEGMKDPALAAKMLDVIKEYAKSQHWKETYTKLKITGKQWGINRNELTGVITGRSIDVIAYATWPDGHCTSQIFGIMEEYDGTSYMEPVYNGVGAQQNIDCK